MDNYERVLQKFNSSKSFTKVLRGVSNGENLQKKLLEKKDSETEEDKEMKLPISFVSPFAENTGKNKKQKGDTYNKNNITLMEAITQNGKQELKLDIKNKKTCFTATAKRNIDNKGLREDMKFIDPNTAAKQRRTEDYNLLLASGKKDAAATIELPKQRNWTDKVVSKLGGDSKSEMMNYLCPYANTNKEEHKLELARQELASIKKNIMEEQCQNKSHSEIDILRSQESGVQKKIDKLTNVVGQKNLQKGILTQKLKYSSNPTLNKNFYNQFEESSYLKAVNNLKENDETNNDSNNDINSDLDGSVESDLEIEGDSEE